MSTVFDKIGTDRQLQDHWLRRLIAGIIDSILIGIVSWIISVLAAIPALFLGGAFIIGGFAFLHGILFLLYAAFLEYSRGATIGKQIMNLKVRTTTGTTVSLYQTLIRNISKIHWILWLIDTIIGMATVGDAQQKFSDRFVGTTVVSTITTGLIIPSSTSPPGPPNPPGST
jgi:uncharacterized RDD family membrane protein YckC